MTTTVLSYDPERYDFRGVLARLIGSERLDRLTADYDDAAERGTNSLYKNMEQSPHFRRLYAGLESPAGTAFYTLYERFVREQIRPQYDEPIYYQRRPSHRLLFADTPGESRFHRDRDYGHHPAEVNYLLVQTPAFDTNTIWIETEEDRADYAPVTLDVGQYVRFKGVHLKHGARLNTTGRSRVSFDFRVLPASQMPAADRSGGPSDEANPIRRNARDFVRCE